MFLRVFIRSSPAKIKMESDESDFEPAPTHFALPEPDQPGPSRVGVRGKGKEWRKIKSCASEDELKEWLAQDMGQWVNSKSHRTKEGLKRYMVCRHQGCSAELLTWLHSETVHASIMLHGSHLHQHDNDECKTRGLTSAMKKVGVKTIFLFRHCSPIYTFSHAFIMGLLRQQAFLASTIESHSLVCPVWKILQVSARSCELDCGLTRLLNHGLTHEI